MLIQVHRPYVTNSTNQFQLMTIASAMLLLLMAK